MSRQASNPALQYSNPNHWPDDRSRTAPRGRREGHRGPLAGPRKRQEPAWRLPPSPKDWPGPRSQHWHTLEYATQLSARRGRSPELSRTQSVQHKSPIGRPQARQLRIKSLQVRKPRIPRRGNRSRLVWRTIGSRPRHAARFPRTSRGFVNRQFRELRRGPDLQRLKSAERGNLS